MKNIAQSVPGPLTLTSASVFDGMTFLDGPQDVVLEGTRITEIRPSGAAPAEGNVVDLSGQVLLPGFIDCHVHVVAERAGSLEAVHEPFSLEFFRAVQNLRATLRTGVTAARDAGGADLGVKEALARGWVEGPELAIAVQIIGQTGGHSDHHTASGADLPFFQRHPGRPRSVADGADDFLRLTRELFRAGADHIKICSTGGVLSPTDDPRHSQMTDEEIRAVVGEAGRQGSYVMSHAQGTDGIQNALRAGVRSIEHGIYLDDETIDLFLEKDAFLVPTLQAPLEVIRGAESGAASLSPVVVEKARRVVEAHRESIGRAIEAGVKIAMGTDAGVGVHGTNLEEIGLLQDAGLSLEGSLRAATSTAADLLNRPDLGRVEKEATASLVAVPEGDLERLGQLRAGDLRVWLKGAEVV
ncbi:Imidazolonepropionase [Kytococcus aerolatus]|uniref:Imidazolonepropionase n=1 Tax=Kytococcus aerolatus TaxID=592308 RepID=A0A212TBY9_9MICO|nr:amidohydrolase family protein [Kytococcus aerolatus]SNC63543.1 Imidazolonepropionase [Kytococcus aerolatus]